MPAERWQAVLAAVDRGDYVTSSGPKTDAPAQVQRVGVSHALRRATPAQLAVIRAAYLKLAGALGLSTRQIAERAALHVATPASLFDVHLPRAETYEALQSAMKGRLKEMKANAKSLVAANGEFDSERLALARDVVGLTQAEMAPLLGMMGGAAGVTISEFERGVKTIPAGRMAGAKTAVTGHIERASDKVLWSTVFGPMKSK